MAFPAYNSFAGVLPWWGTEHRFDQPGNAPGFPDPEEMPVAQGAATGNQFPINHLRSDACNYVNQNSNWVSGMTAQRNWCAQYNMALSFQALYPQFVNPTITDLNNWATNIKNNGLFTGIPWVFFMMNECLTEHISGTPSDWFNMGPNLVSTLGGGDQATTAVKFIQWVRSTFPSNCLVGFNDFNMGDRSSGSYTVLTPNITLHNWLATQGAACDFYGAEGYALATGFSGFSDPISMINGEINSFATSTGIPTMYTECSPCRDGIGSYSSQKSVWQAMIQAFVANQYIFGATMPWGGPRVSINKSSGGGQNDWLWNDTSSPAGSSFDGSNAAGYVTPTLTWLQGYIPTVVPSGVLPSISSISPVGGPYFKTNPVTITGSNF